MFIKTDYSKVFSYARMQNGIPAVRSIVLKNDGQETLRDVRLTVRFDPGFTADYESVISELAPREKAVIDHVRILPSASFLANLSERINVSLRATAY